MSVPGPLQVVITVSEPKVVAFPGSHATETKSPPFAAAKADSVEKAVEETGNQWQLYRQADLEKTTIAKNAPREKVKMTARVQTTSPHKASKRKSPPPIVDALAVMMNQRALAMHHFSGMAYLCSVGIAYALVPQAYTQDR